ncbi:putative transcription regulator mTERF family [Rosa chinensis]|uniref:Putative transcription regulator mTERF family n=1 Tax=Rosa chinensis TaxID=74649 RepID=A0A2P6PWK2_ROSCH|nr:putative transcription regulator mTERF family [Rosa chinensis]
MWAFPRSRHCSIPQGTQISTLVRRHPRILLADAKKTLAPKLEFFCSVGMSRLDLAKTVTHSQSILDRSLENHIVPSFNLLKDVVHSDVKVLGILKCSPWIFRQKLSKTMMPNIELLRALGMPQSSIARLLTYYVQIVMKEPESFSQLVGEVEQLGFDLRKTFFVQAMLALSGKNKTTWKRNEEAYRRWGWSDNDILSAFRLYPLCMTKSEKKIMGTMDFLVNKMGWHSQKIAKCPHVLCFSFEKRIIPRFSVVKVLMLKGLVEEEKLSLSTIVAIPENYFLNKFVTTNLRLVPELLNVYHGKVDVQDV